MTTKPNLFHSHIDTHSCWIDLSHVIFCLSMSHKSVSGMPVWIEFCLSMSHKSVSGMLVWIEFDAAYTTCIKST